MCETVIRTLRNCVVTSLRKMESTAVVINLDEYRSIKKIADAGLIPPLRYSESIEPLGAKSRKSLNES